MLTSLWSCSSATLSGQLHPICTMLLSDHSDRTMKVSVSGELTIPKQTRYLVPIELGRVERHVRYIHLFRATAAVLTNNFVFIRSTTRTSKRPCWSSASMFVVWPLRKTGKLIQATSEHGCADYVVSAHILKSVNYRPRQINSISLACSRPSGKFSR